MREWVLVVLLAVLIGLLFLPRAGRGPEEDGPTPASSELSVRYHYTTEVAYEEIVIEQRSLRYTYFDRTDVRCREWLAQVPCWAEEDLITKEASLPEEEFQALVERIERSGFLKQQGEPSAPTPPERRAYSYVLLVRLDGREREVTHYSYPEGPPPPEDFRQVSEVLQALVAKLDLRGQGIVWRSHPSGLRAGLYLYGVHRRRLMSGDRPVVYGVVPGKPVRITFYVANASSEEVSIPEPGAGTVVWHLGEEIRAAEPGQPDRWIVLEPGEVVSHRLTHTWEEEGTYEVKAVLRSRFEERPFEPLETETVLVQVGGCGGYMC